MLKIKKRKVVDVYNNTLYTDKLYFTFVSDTLEQSSITTACREILVGCILLCRNYLNPIPVRSYVVGKDALISLKHLRLCLIFRCNPTDAVLPYDLEKGIRGINQYEALAGWEKSIIKKVTHEQYTDEKYHCMLITASPNWMSHPQLLSMYCLLLRVMSNTSLNVDVTDINSIHESIDTLTKSYLSSKDYVEVDEDVQEFLVGPGKKTMFKKYAYVMEHIEKIFDFSDMALETAWIKTSSTGKYVTFRIKSGILSFLLGCTGYSPEVKEYQNRFKTMWNKTVKTK